MKILHLKKIEDDSLASSLMVGTTRGSFSVGDQEILSISWIHIHFSLGHRRSCTIVRVEGNHLLSERA